ncbi:MAG: O-antigen ligase family protein [Hominenteromicrobium sp.]
MQKIRTVLDRYLLNRVVFKVLIVVMTMITAVPYLHMRVGGYVKILLAYGYVILAYEALTGKYLKLYREKSSFLLLAFCVSYAVTILLNRELNLSANVKALAYMFLFFSLFFMTDPDRTSEALSREVQVVSMAVIGCTFVLSCVSFATYMFSINGHYLTDNGFIYFGMYDNRLWGVYNANTGSTLNSISILLSIGFLVKRRSILTVLLNAVNILLQFCCLTLTGSRAALYALTVILAALILILCVRRYLHRHDRLTARGFLTGLLAAAAAAVVFLFGVDAAKAGLSYVPSLTSNLSVVITMQENPEEELEFELEQYELTRVEELENREGGIFTGRLDIWKACFAAFRERPLFGTTRENIPDYAIGHLENDLWASNIKVGGPHNIYLCILVSSGLVGFCLMAAFAGNMLVRAVTALLRHIRTCPVWMIISLLLTVMFFIVEFVESRILYQVGIFYALFWIYSGYAFAFAKRCAAEKQEVTQIE